MTDIEDACNPVTPEKVRKHRRKLAKYRSAEEKGVTLLEGALVGVKGDVFTVYVWNGTDWVPSLNGTLDS